MVANKGTNTDSDCHQLIGTLRETIPLFMDEHRNKQVTIDNLKDVIKNFTVIGYKYKRNKEQETKSDCNIKYICVEVNLRKRKWFINGSYNPSKNFLSNYLERLNCIIDEKSKLYQNFLFFGIL